MILTQQPVTSVLSKNKSPREVPNNEVLEYSLKLLKDKGSCMAKYTMNLFKDKILDQHGCTVSDNDCESYDLQMILLIKRKAAPLGVVQGQ